MDRKITEGHIEETQYFSSSDIRPIEEGEYVPPVIFTPASVRLADDDKFVFNRKQGMTLGDIASVIDGIYNALEKYKDQLPGTFYENVKHEVNILMMLTIETVRKHYECKSMHEIAELIKQLNDITGDEIDRI